MNPDEWSPDQSTDEQGLEYIHSIAFVILSDRGETTRDHSLARHLYTHKGHQGSEALGSAILFVTVLTGVMLFPNDLSQRLARGWLSAIVMVSVAFGLLSCGSASLGSIDAGADSTFRQAQQFLAQHRVSSARDEYRRILLDNPDSGRAAAGVAVTETLLIPARGEVDGLVTAHLGAEGPIDVNRALYADNGYLYWWSRGTPWIGQGSQTGIRDLIASRLPWSAQELRSLSDFTDGLTEPTGSMRRDLADLASSLNDIESSIQTALDDPDFESFFLPGEVFHDDDLSMTLRRSELAALGALVASLRAAIHGFRSYEHGWSLEEAFGPQWEEAASNNPPEREGWTAWDYSVDFLSTRLATTRAGRQPRQQMRDALTDALRWAERSITFGLEQPEANSRLAWDQIDAEYAQNLRSVLAAFRNGLSQSTDIPTSSPTTSVNYSGFFSEGRVLGNDFRWWNPNPVRADESDPDSDVLYIEWLWSDPAVQTTLVDGFFDPAIDITGDGSIESRIGALENVGTFWETLLRMDSTTDSPR